MRAWAVLVLISGAYALTGCDLEKAYDLQNPTTGRRVRCLAWATTFFDAGVTTNPGPFRNCIAACEAHGFKPVSQTGEDAKDEKGTDTFVPSECR